MEELSPLAGQVQAFNQAKRGHLPFSAYWPECKIHLEQCLVPSEVGTKKLTSMLYSGTQVKNNNKKPPQNKQKNKKQKKGKETAHESLKSTVENTQMVGGAQGH